MKYLLTLALAPIIFTMTMIPALVYADPFQSAHTHSGGTVVNTHIADGVSSHTHAGSLNSNPNSITVGGTVQNAHAGDGVNFHSVSSSIHVHFHK